MIVGLILATIGAVFTVYFFFFSHKRIQERVDALTLSCAATLNARDRVGQMNNLIARCRELVFNSRQIHQRALFGYAQTEPLARQLLEESRAGARLVEAERARLSFLCLAQVREFTKAKEKELEGGIHVFIPGMKIAQPVINNVDVGFIQDVESNVESGEGNPDLEQHDLNAQYIQKESKLYLGNINAKLPAPDDDLDFKLSSLAAPVEGAVASPRLATQKVFRAEARVIENQVDVPYECDQIPSAVRLDYLVNIKGGDHQQDSHEIGISSVASTSGAYPAP